MNPSAPHLRTCSNGHHYHKSSDCPTCPICEQERKPQDGLLSLLAAPARRALEKEGIYTIEKLAEYREADLLRLHGLGPRAITRLRSALEEQGLVFRKN